jgi:hypothetical protein
MMSKKNFRLWFCGFLGMLWGLSAQASKVVDPLNFHLSVVDHSGSDWHLKLEMSAKRDVSLLSIKITPAEGCRFVHQHEERWNGSLLGHDSKQLFLDVSTDLGHWPSLKVSATLDDQLSLWKSLDVKPIEDPLQRLKLQSFDRILRGGVKEYSLSQ